MSEVVKKKKTDATVTTANENLLTPFGMISEAIRAGASVDVMQGLFNLQKDWEANEARKSFYRDFALFKADVPKILKSKHVEFTTSRGVTKYNHAELDKMLDILCDKLSTYNLSVSWRTESLPPNQGLKDGKPVFIERIRVTCVLSHSDGHIETNFLDGNPDNSGGKNDIQAIGSSVTYLSRYTVKAILGIAESGDDTDGMPPQKFVTEDQQKEIISKLTEYKADVEAFFRFMRIGDIKSLAESRFQDAMAFIELKKPKPAEIQLPPEKIEKNTDDHDSQTQEGTGLFK